MEFEVNDGKTEREFFDSYFSNLHKIIFEQSACFKINY